MSETVDVDMANHLWAELRRAFVRADEVLVRIHKAKAWEPLGYPSFTAAWADRMQGVRLAVEIRAHVVYVMLEEGLTAEEIRDAVGYGSGLGLDSIETLARQRRNGVPPGLATTVRRHERARPGQPATLHVDLGSATLKRYRDAASDDGKSLEDVAKHLLSGWFERRSTR